MFSIIKIFKRKKIVPHIRLSGVIGAVGKFRQGLDFKGQQEIINKYQMLLQYYDIDHETIKNEFNVIVEEKQSSNE